MEIFKKLSDQRHKPSNLKARLKQSEQPAALPAPQLPKEKHALKRAQPRYGIRDGDAAPDSEPFAFRVEEAARLIGVSRATIYVLIARGDLRTIKIRKRRLVPREALLKLLSVGAAE